MSESMAQVNQATVTFPLPPERSPGDDVPLPSVLAKRSQRAVASTGLTPMFEFIGVGDWCMGRLMRVRSGVGKNDSMVYVFNTEGYMDKVPAIVGVWGATILDDRMASPEIKTGVALFIQYLGTVETTRDQNPAKNFRVLLV